MNRKTQRTLEAAGFRVADAEDFLNLTYEERRLVELRVAVSRTIRRVRAKHKLTQQQLADRLQSSQSRVAKLEAGAGDVSLDLLFRGLFALGGRLADLGLSLPRKVRAKAS
jgi:ribosome-binding protein aMBF1 (putative translation factor)